jgi:tetratricopeptide (TPR) repeat protein
MQIHPNDVLLRALLNSGGGSHEVRKHLDKCPKCQARLRVLGKARWQDKPGDYGSAIERSLAAFQKRQSAYAKERDEAPGLLDRLLRQPAERQALILRNSRKFQTWAILDLLLQQSQHQSFLEPMRSEDFARLALKLSNHLDSGFYGEERIQDLRARAWGYIGNARRLKVDLAGAEDAFSRAFLYLRQGTGESMERAGLLGLKASLRRFQGRFDECLHLLQRAVSLFQEVGQDHGVGRSLVQIATVKHCMGRSLEALPLLEKALDLIDRSLEPRLLLCAWHNLVDDLATLGRFMEAQGLLTKGRALYQEFPDPATQSRRMWVEAKIACGLGRLHEAEVHLLKARDGFVAADLPSALTVLSQDLAAIRRRLG